jgi:hypothetical protein
MIGTWQRRSNSWIAFAGIGAAPHMTNCSDDRSGFTRGGSEFKTR